MSPAPELSPRRVALRDGSEVLLRPIEPEDKERLARGLARLSERSRSRRFLSPMGSFSSAELRYLTEIDYADHMAWIALDPSGPEQPAVGVARYVKLPDSPGVAEAAVVVDDAWQGRGLGSILLATLALSATRHGVRAFRGYVQRGNDPLLDLVRGLGAELRDDGEGVLQVDLPLEADPARLPETPTGRVFRAVASQLLSLEPGPGPA